VNFFIRRPIFAISIACVMVLVGAISMLVLPVAQYPPLAPPQIKVSTQYIGASAGVVAKTVTKPLEEKINGAGGMIYMSSTSTNNGDSAIVITFEVGFDPNTAQMDVLTRSNQALPELPAEVKQVGLTIEKQSTNMLLAVNLISPKGTYDAQFLQNYADIHIADSLSRIPGVASVMNMALRKYAIRIWIDPEKLSGFGLTAADVRDAIKEQNRQVAAGKIGAPPAPSYQVFQYQLSTEGRLSQVSQFENIIIRANPDGSMVRVKDVANVELGAEDYDWDTKLNGKPTATLIVYQLPDANGLQIKKQVVSIMERLQKDFPHDVKWTMRYDTTKFIAESMKEVVHTLIEAIILVVMVVYIFLQNFGSVIIPTLAIPVSIIGTFAFMKIFGFSINALSMLGLVLAVALVVDDAIVVVENVMRKIEEGDTRSMPEITAEAMDEVRGPVIATSLVLLVVFVPVAFIPGMTGMLYNQFALTIAFSVAISSFNALTLSPALCTIMLHHGSVNTNKVFQAFNRGFDKLSDAYGEFIRFMAKWWQVSMIAFLVLCVLTVFLFKITPTGFVPEEDQGYIFAIAQLPPGSTVRRTDAVMSKVTEMARSTPGVADVIGVSGYNLVDSVKQPYAGFSFIVLKPWGEREEPETQLPAIMKNLQAKVSQIPEAYVMISNAPAIPGLGSTGGFKMQLLDLNGQGLDALAKVANNFVAEARKRPELAGVYTTFKSDVPLRFIKIDRFKAKTRRVKLSDLFDTLQMNLGSLYVNDFNRYGKSYRVYIQAKADARSKESDVFKLKVRNMDGKMIDMGSFIQMVPKTGPYTISHYKLYSSIAVNGANAPGYSTGQAIKAMEDVAKKVLPEGFDFEWTDVTYQQLKAGNMAPIIFGLALVMIFLVLAAQYESWSMPFMVLLGVPLGLMGAVAFLLLRGLVLDVYAQIGLVMLIGLTAKNAILIVEFAAQERQSGKSPLESAVSAARLRLRPILMTALAFVIGLIPLLIATGAGANSRRSLGTVVVGGLLVATVLVMFVPIFYYVIERLRERGSDEDEGPGNEKDDVEEVVYEG